MTIEKSDHISEELTNDELEIFHALEEEEAPGLTEQEEAAAADYKEAERNAVEQIAQLSLYGIQSAARWYCKNPKIIIDIEHQEQFKKAVPDLLDECEIEAPEFLAAYQHRIGFAFICLNIIGSIAQQQIKHNEILLLENQENEIPNAG